MHAEAITVSKSANVSFARSVCGLLRLSVEWQNALRKKRPCCLSVWTGFTVLCMETTCAGRRRIKLGTLYCARLGAFPTFLACSQCRVGTQCKIGSLFSSHWQWNSVCRALDLLLHISSTFYWFSGSACNVSCWGQGIDSVNLAIAIGHRSTEIDFS